MYGVRHGYLGQFDVAYGTIINVSVIFFAMLVQINYLDHVSSDPIRNV